jgi:antitoxin component YwqK of YwqJK toxin-antitoxin module
MRNLLVSLLIIGLYACRPAQAPQSTPDTAVQAASQGMEGYSLQAVAGTDLIQATKYNNAQQVLEIGFFLNDLPEGTWKYYDPTEPEFPNKVISFHRGIKQGLYLELNERGEILLQANYLNDQLHGPWGMYKLGRPLKTTGYLNGQLDGPYREYTATKGTLQREIYYKMGKEDGSYRYFNEEGEVTVEYQYKNGEKISGGIVE